MTKRKKHKHPKVAPFKFHGFEYDEDGTGAGQQAVGNCLLCGKANHFYVSTKTGQWDCKSCGSSGNVVTFLSDLVDARQKTTTTADYKRLAADRNLPWREFKRYGFAWDDHTERWLLPMYSTKGTVRDVRVYREGRGQVISTTDCNAQLFGCDELANLAPGATVWVCEGEWDKVALSWVMRAAGVDQACAVAVPGAATFKSEWCELFAGFDVCLAYDNDTPGHNGRKKAAKKLADLARSLAYVEWPNTCPEGFDVRDVVVHGIETDTDPVEVKDAFEGWLSECTEDDGTVIVNGNGNAVERHPVLVVGGVPDKDIPTFDEVLDVFDKHVAMSPDMEDGLRIACAHALSTDVEGDPIWAYIVGPPGCGKTLLLMALQGSARVDFVSSMTPHSLVSGFRGDRDPSVLPTWHGKCAVLKDFTEILAAHPQAKDELFGTLRGAYDGHVCKVFGNAVKREYWLRFALLAGVTPSIHGDRHATLGERFLKFEMMRGSDWDADREIRAAIGNIARESAMETALVDVTGRFLSQKVERLGALPPWVVDRVVALAQLIAALRANVEREVYGDQRLKYRPQREVGTRLAKQLVKLGQLVAIVDGKDVIDAEVYRLVERVAFDTAIGFHLDLVQALMHEGGAATREEIAEVVDLPYTTLSRSLEDLASLKVVRPHKRKRRRGERGRPGTTYIVADWVAELWERAAVGADHVMRGMRVRRRVAGNRVKVRKRGLTPGK